MVDPGVKGFEPIGALLTDAQIMTEFYKPTDKRVFAIAQALETGQISPADITINSCIDPWFISRLVNIADFRKNIRGKSLHGVDKPMMIEAKQLGFSDPQLAALFTVNGKPTTEDIVREHRVKKLGVEPWVKQIDTLANYLYMTYHAMEHDLNTESQSHIVLGSGSYRIGSSVEFDW
jgi:hypothetical protein